MRRLRSRAAGALLATCVAAGLVTMPACRQLRTNSGPLSTDSAESTESAESARQRKPWWQRILPPPDKFEDLFIDERSQEIERNLDRNSGVTIRG